DSRGVIAGEEAGLELADPVVALQGGEVRLTGHAFLEGALHEPAIVERAECRGRSAQHPDERERRGNSVEKEAKPLHERRHVLGLTLDLIERMARGEENGAEGAPGIGSERRVTVLSRHLEGTTRRIDSFIEGAYPWDQDRPQEIGPSPEVI